MKESRSRENIIIGRGMLAKAFENLPDSNALIFASGVSNSSEKRRSEFTREIDYLIKCCNEFPDKKLLYFSSYAAENGNSFYDRHKMNIESLIQDVSNDFLIFRLPQVVGFSNNDTLFNYLIKSVCRNEQIVIYRNAYRSLLDVIDLVRVVSLIISSEAVNKVIPVGPASPKSIIEILRRIELVVGVEANVCFVDAGDCQSANMETLISFIGHDDPILRDDYQDKVIVKYAENIIEKEFK